MVWPYWLLAPRHSESVTEEFLSASDLATLRTDATAGNALREGIYSVNRVPLYFFSVPAGAISRSCPRAWRTGLVQFPELVPLDGPLRYWKRHRKDLTVDTTDTEQMAAVPAPSAVPLASRASS